MQVNPDCLVRNKYLSTKIYIMKNGFVFIVVLISLLCDSCKKCDCNVYATDSRVSSSFFKVGSYFIYNNATDHIIDSQYVISYNYQPNSVVVGLGADCNPKCYTSTYKMWVISYRNGLYYDSIYSYSDNPDDLYYDYGNRAPFGAFFDPSSDGQSGHAPLDTPFNNFAVGGNVYAKVYKVSNCEIFHDTVSTDLYFAPGYGVVKRLEHPTTGNVSWDLIRYHIVQ